MLYYVRGDGGMAMVPVSELIQWAKESRIAQPTSGDERLYNAKVALLLAELEAMGT